MSARPLVDWRTAACLDDGWQAVVAVEADGTASLWLLDPADDGGHLAPPIPAHEHTGLLPLAWRARVATTRRVQPRCGRPRKDGAPCRTPVARPGDACGNHRRTAATS